MYIHVGVHMSQGTFLSHPWNVEWCVVQKAFGLRCVCPLLSHTAATPTTFTTLLKPGMYVCVCVCVFPTPSKSLGHQPSVLQFNPGTDWS